MAYCSSSDVAALCKNLTSGGSDFTTSTSPTLAQVNTWISAGSSLFDATLAGMGFGTIPATSVAYDLATQVNASFAAYRAERSRSNPRTAPGEKGRAEQLKDDYIDMLETLTTLDLSRMSVSQTSKAYSGGISVSDKKTVEGDSDRVSPRFIRGANRNIDSLEPGSNNSGTPTTL